MNDNKNNKISRNIINMSIFTLMIIGILIVWQYEHGIISKKETMFFVSMIVAIASFADFTYSLVFNESVAKGVILKKENAPILYIISVTTTFILLLLAIYGVFYYW